MLCQSRMTEHDNLEPGGATVTPEMTATGPTLMTSTTPETPAAPWRRLTTAPARARLRRRPSGFGFALADCLTSVNPAHWRHVTAGASLFCQRPYLEAVEQAGPATLAPRYAVVYRGREPVAALLLRLASVSGDQFVPGPPTPTDPVGLVPRLVRPVAHEASTIVRERVLVCGDLLSWGLHGIAVAPGQDLAALWPAVAEACYRVRRAEKLGGQPGIVVVKDVAAGTPGVAALGAYGYHAVETDPDMVLDLAPGWRRYEDYAAALNAKYRQTARQIRDAVAKAGCRVEPCEDLAAEAARLHALYLQVRDHATPRPVRLPADFLPTLAAALGERFRCAVVRRDDQLVGFVTALRDGDTVVAHMIGLDRAVAAEVPVYLRLLQEVVGMALELGGRRLSLGRTALAPKAALGARPEPLSLWLRHGHPAVNLLVENLVRLVPHDAPPPRQPFRVEPPPRRTPARPAGRGA
jgi:hypothetical protein